MASKASLTNQQKQVQENIHSQIETFCTTMDDIVLPNLQSTEKAHEPIEEKNITSRRSGLSLAVGRSSPLNEHLGKEQGPMRLKYLRNVQILSYQLHVTDKMYDMSHG